MQLVPFDEAYQVSLGDTQRPGRMSPGSTVPAAGSRADGWKRHRGTLSTAMPGHVGALDGHPQTTDRLLLCCAQSRFDDEARARSRELIGEGIDWERLLTLAAKHRLLPLLYARLRDLDDKHVPEAALARAEAAFYATLRRNVLLQHELGQIVGSLHEENVEVIVLKGGALAWTVYASPAMRPMVDLDLLVHPEHMERVGCVLGTLGFHRSESLPARMVPFQERFGGGAMWIRERKGKVTGLDVQHDLVGVDWCRQAFPIEADALWEAALPLDLGETLARQLSPVDALIHLCLHPPLHHGYVWPLLGYVDIDRLIGQAGSDLFWRQLMERVRRFRAKTIVYWGLTAIHDVLATPVPAEVLAELAPRGARLRLLRRLAPLGEDVVLQEGATRPRTGVRQVLLYAVLADRLRDAWHMLRSILFPDLEWLTVRYALQGKRQARLYRLVHPFRVARAFVRGLYQPLVASSLE
jgi:hypothetical protein